MNPEGIPVCIMSVFEVVIILAALIKLRKHNQQIAQREADEKRRI